MEIPLFPLHTVLCPGVAIPLHIFEDRYRALVAHCLKTGRPFGVVLIRDGREVGSTSGLAVAGVGTFASIREANRHPDGRYDILAVGGLRFSLDQVVADREPWLVGEVTPLPEGVGDRERAAVLARHATRLVVDHLRLIRPRDGEDADMPDVRVEIEVEDEPGAEVVGTEAPGPEAVDADAPSGAAVSQRLIVPDDPAILSYLLLGMVQLDLVRKQELLEAATAEDRLARLGDMLEQENRLLVLRLRRYAPDPRVAGIRRN